MSSPEQGESYGPSESPGESMSEEELRAAYEAEIKQVRVEQVLLEQVVSLVNLGMRRTGLGPGTEDERDLGQVRLAIDSVRALLPLVEQIAAPQAGQIRDALSQLQLAFVRLGGSAAGAAAQAPGAADVAGGAGAAGAGPKPTEAGPAGGPGGAGQSGPPPAGPQPTEDKPGEGGPAQRSGRLWIPGQ